MSGTNNRLPRPLCLDGDDIERVQRTFDFDATDTERLGLDGAAGSFQRLDPSQRRRIRSNLSNRRRRYAIKRIYSLFDQWKSGVSDDPEAACTLEAIVREALDCDAKLRYEDRFDPAVGETSVDTLKDLFRVSQAFLRENYGERRRVYRGIRGQAIASLTAQLLDNPDAEQFHVETSVVSNHTGSEAISYEYANGVVIEWDVHRYDIAMAVDHVFDAGSPEDELHVLGGVITLPPDAILHKGHHSDSIRTLSATIDDVDEPRRLSREQHRDVLELVRIMERETVGVRTDAGAERLGEWYREFQAVSELPDSDLDRYQDVVEAVRVMDRGQEWDF